MDIIENNRHETQKLSVACTQEKTDMVRHVGE